MIISFNRYNGGGGSGSGVTPQDVQRQIDSALTPYWESGETKDYVDGAVSGISLEGYYTSGETDEKISQAVAPFYTSGQTDEKIAEAVAPFYTSAQTDEKISQAVAPFYTSGETDEAIAHAVSGLATEQYVQDALSGVSLEDYYTSAQTEEAIVSKNYVTSAQVETQIQAKNYVNSGDVKSQVEAYNYATVSQIPTVPTSNTAFTNDAGYITDAAVENLVTSAQVETQIDTKAAAYTPTSGFSTINGSAITNGGNIVIQGGGGDMSNYWNSAETKSYVDSAATNLQDQIDTMDEVVADALNDLNGDVAAVSGAVSDLSYGQQPVVRTQSVIEGQGGSQYMVDPVTRIVSTDQDTYNQMQADGLISPQTFYIIVNNS